MAGKAPPASETPTELRSDAGALASRLMAWIGVSMKKSRNMEGLQILSDLGMTVPQSIALHMCAFESDVTLSTLVERLSLSPSAVSSMVQRLVELELVTRVEDERDRRQKRVQVTESGRAFIQRMMAARYDDMRAAFEPLSDATRADLARALDRMLKEVAPDLATSMLGTDMCCPTSLPRSPAHDGSVNDSTLPEVSSHASAPQSSKKDAP